MRKSYRTPKFMIQGKKNESLKSAQRKKSKMVEYLKKTIARKQRCTEFKKGKIDSVK